LAAVRNDNAQYIATAREKIEKLEKAIMEDLKDNCFGATQGWDTETLRKGILAK
jgi:hypothetical protein